MAKVELCKYLNKIFVHYLHGLFFFIGAVRKNAITAAATRSEVETAAKNWLRYAHDRLGARRMRYDGKRRQELNDVSEKRQKKNADHCTETNGGESYLSDCD